ncbi:hypothetical protein B9Z35_01675 [Limnohabitans sp. Jir61]|nr:hypothetical protein B9Z35_01675 [Limnohabitans sp. Jir61]
MTTQDAVFGGGHGVPLGTDLGAQKSCFRLFHESFNFSWVVSFFSGADPETIDEWLRIEHPSLFLQLAR